MIPLIEDYIKSLMTARLNWLKQNSDQIPEIFGVLGKRSSLKNFTEYVKRTDFNILLGFPKEANQVPCYVITLAGEQEVTSGIGDNFEEDFDDEGNFYVDSNYMEANFRIEVWSDNLDLLVYMYILSKWAMLVSRKDMLSNGFVLPRISGADLEPAPEYLPIFVYRRALMLNFQYENQFYEDEQEINEIKDIKYTSGIYTSDIDI